MIIAFPIRAGFAAGDHVRAHRFGYWHHGIYLGDDTVVHFAGDARKDAATAKIRRTTFEEFADGQPVEVVRYGEPTLESDEVIRRALTLLNRRDYALVSNNCEHFARWCKTGTPRSEQVVNAILLSAVAALIWWSQRSGSRQESPPSPSNAGGGAPT